MRHAINVILSIIDDLAGLVMQLIASIDQILVHAMVAAHIPQNIQTVLLVVVAVALIVLAIRLFGGVFAVLITLLLLLLVLHRLDPSLVMPHSAPHHATAPATHNQTAIP